MHTREAITLHLPRTMPASSTFRPGNCTAAITRSGAKSRAPFKKSRLLAGSSAAAERLNEMGRGNLRNSVSRVRCTHFKWCLLRGSSAIIISRARTVSAARSTRKGRKDRKFTQAPGERERKVRLSSFPSLLFCLRGARERKQWKSARSLIQTEQQSADKTKRLSLLFIHVYAHIHICMYRTLSSFGPGSEGEREEHVSSTLLGFALPRINTPTRVHSYSLKLYSEGISAEASFLLDT
jgi:hypothetical protein